MCFNQGQQSQVFLSVFAPLSLQAPLYWDVFVPKGMSSAQVVLTCHNFEYQGTEHNSSLASCGLDVARQLTPQRMQDNFLHDKVNLLKVRWHRSTVTQWQSDSNSGTQ